MRFSSSNGVVKIQYNAGTWWVLEEFQVQMEEVTKKMCKEEMQDPVQCRHMMGA
jgi:hypothetical protein